MAIPMLAGSFNLTGTSSAALIISLKRSRDTVLPIANSSGFNRVSANIPGMELTHSFVIS